MTNHEPASFGDLLRRYRQERGLTQEELAERANLSARAISELERGARQYPYRSTMQLLAAALQLSPPQRAAFEQAGRRPAAARAAAVLSLEVGAAPPGKGHAHNLPAQLTSFVGRGAELAQIGALLGSAGVRLLTLTGPPGAGKTRLGLAVGAQLLPAFPDGVFLVELAAVSDPDLVASAIAGTLGVPETSGSSPIDSVKQRLAAKALLLVLDNFEQVLAAAPLVSGLLQACPRVKALVTSRERLHVRAEKEYPVPPLTVPEPNPQPPPERLGQYEAVQLFVERARDAKPDFALTEENGAAVAAITRRLDGLPLALELAAARTRIFTPQALLDRLQSGLQVLTGGHQDLPARQQTLRAAITWSHDLLSAPEQALFRRLGVFAGGATLAAVEAICADEGPAAGSDDPALSTLDAVESLAGKSLVQYRAGRWPEPRFVLLEMTREYAREQLAASGELEALRERHALYFLELAEQIEPSLWTQQATNRLRNLEPEQENLRAALEWALKESGGGERAKAAIGLRLCAAIWRFWDFKGYLREGRRWLETALEYDSGRVASADTWAEQAVLDRARAWVLIGAGSMAGDQGDYATGSSRMREGLSLSRKLGYQWGIMAALLTLETQVAAQGDYATARTLLEEALNISRDLGDKENTAAALNMLGGIFQSQGDAAMARALLEESLALNRELESRWGTAQTLLYLGELAYEQADLALAGALLAESLATNRELENKWDSGLALRNLASIALVQDDLAPARALCAECLVVTRDLGDQRGLAHGLAIMAGIAARSGTTGHRAAILVGATGALLAGTSTVLWTMQQRIYEQAAGTARQQLGDEPFEAARREGAALSLEQAVAYALDGEGRSEALRDHAH